jgi:uncharacterized protein (TIGR03435 family)
VAMMLGPMMQRLLEDRFHLKIHRETREGPVYFLTVARGGPKSDTPRVAGGLMSDQRFLAETSLAAETGFHLTRLSER